MVVSALINYMFGAEKAKKTVAKKTVDKTVAKKTVYKTIEKKTVDKTIEKKTVKKTGKIRIPQSTIDYVLCHWGRGEPIEQIARGVFLNCLTIDGKAYVDKRPYSMVMRILNTNGVPYGTECSIVLSNRQSSMSSTRRCSFIHLFQVRRNEELVVFRILVNEIHDGVAMYKKALASDRVARCDQV